jgi:regulator of RNase E activity RraB
MHEDIWNVFPATMEQGQAWIAYNHSFGEQAESDPRNYALRVRVEFKDPNEQGLPTNEEFPALSALDEALDEAIAGLGGIYVGRLTVGGARYFYYYSNGTEEELNTAIGGVSDSSGYELTLEAQEDPDKERYFNELFPTEDDWQVIQDLQVLDQLQEAGDNPDNEREIEHWAYFDNQGAADQFAAWAKSEGFTIQKNKASQHEPEEQEEEGYVVQFNHVGTTHLADISNRTIRAGQKARELGGNYDGWGTTVERD